ncbi:MAG: divalent-cation tolerance protein CutA [Deltaproteobacteria bacterium]
MVLATAPDVRSARRIARALIDDRLCACVNIIPAVRSIYRWKGVIHEDGELLLVIKTSRARLSALERRLSALHPYDVPEVLALPVEQGHGPYLDWLLAETKAG